MFKLLRKTALWIVAVPLLCVFLGAGLNQAVLVANHDKFPVMWSDAKVQKYRTMATTAAGQGNEEAAEALTLLKQGFIDDVHVLMTHSTRLNWLADWIDLESATYSPGDLILFAGEKSLGYAPLIWAFVAVGKLRKRDDREF